MLYRSLPENVVVVGLTFRFPIFFEVVGLGGLVVGFIKFFGVLNFV